MNTCQMSIEEMETKRSGLYMKYISAIGTEREKALVRELDLMDEIIDAMIGYEEEQEEEPTIAINWDEWMLDNRIDQMREDRMAYEV